MTLFTGKESRRSFTLVFTLLVPSNIINTANGKVGPPSVNIDDAVAIGKKEMFDF